VPSSIRSRRLALLAALLVPPTGDAAQEVARTGDPAVGLSGETYYSFDPLGFTEAGALLFGSQSQLLPGAADGIWQWTDAGGIEPILLGGDDTPYGLLKHAVANENGDFAFEGVRLAPPQECGETSTANSTDALWRANAGEAPIEVWRSGDLVPGAPGSLRFLNAGTPLQYMGPLRMSSSDVLVFGAILGLDECVFPSPVQRSAIFHHDAAGVLRLAALADEPAPGATDDGRFSAFGWQSRSLHASGRFVFGAGLRKFGGLIASGIYRYDPVEGLVPIAIGEWGDSYSRTHFSAPSIDTDGTVYFRRIRSEGFLTLEWEILAQTQSEALETRIASGDVLPDPQESIVASFPDPSEARLNGAGDLATAVFLDENLEPTRDWAIVEVAADGALTVRLREGDVAPDSGGGVFVARPSILRFGYDGMLLIIGTVTTSPFGTEYGTFLLRREGSAQRIGYPPPSSATIVFDPSGSTAAVVEGDGSGDAYMLSVAAVPEPATLALALTALATLVATAITTSRRSPPA